MSLGMSLPHWRYTLPLCLALACSACGRKSSSEAEGAKAEAAAKAAATPKVPEQLWNEFNGENALNEAKKQVACGPRPSGSPEIQKARELIVESLRQSSWSADLQEFTAQTPHGPKKFVNILARFVEAGTPTPQTVQRVIVASHYDTKYFSTIDFVGANDGASSTGALLELARTLSMDPPFAKQFELVFFDGEEAIQQFSDSDGLYGSRFYAANLRESGRARQFQLGIVWDMIGDKDLTITIPSNCPEEIPQGIFKCAEALSVRNAFSLFGKPMLDDHVPLNVVARIPTVDLIDFDYKAWHTADDTLDQISAKSLQTVGMTTLHYLKQVLKQP